MKKTNPCNVIIFSQIPDKYSQLILEGTLMCNLSSQGSEKWTKYWEYQEGFFFLPRDSGHVVTCWDEEVEIFFIMQVREPG